ncbi:MAG: DUF58 domain-containing protein [Oscillospiraceae bacterium]|nr:DUF58 domain-containing protein [Oscillospiraceae bacterium]
MPKNIRAEKGALKILPGYLGAIALTVIFALFCSGTIGWFFFTVMLLLPIISVVTAAIVLKYITVTADISQTRLYKHESAVMRITVSNRSYIPAPTVYAELDSSQALVCSAASGLCSIDTLPRSEQTAEVSFTAKMWYPSSAGVKSLYITDHIGLVRFALPCESLRFDVDIIPDIADITDSEELVAAISDAAAQGDDCEETLDTRAIGFTGTPGFEHREYVPGDPIKRINWKLSCKKDELLVRLDDRVSAAKHTFILDRLNVGGSPKNGEICGENMLGVLTAVIRTGSKADLWFYLKDWQCFGIEDENDIARLRLSLAGYRFSDTVTSGERIPYAEIAAQSGRKSSSMTFFTPCFDRSLSGVITIGKGDSKTDVSVSAAAASAEKGADTDGVWILSRGSQY